MVLTTIGKKLTSATTRILGRRSKPNQMTKIGAMAGIGTSCDTTSHG